MIVETHAADMLDRIMSSETAPSLGEIQQLKITMVDDHPAAPLDQINTGLAALNKKKRRE